MRKSRPASGDNFKKSLLAAIQRVTHHILFIAMAETRQDTPDGDRGSHSAMDPELFAAHYRQAYPRLHLVAAAIIGDRTYAHDIVQEAAVIALQKAERFHEGASHVAWLSEIVRRCSLNYLNKIRGRKTSAADPELLAQIREGNSARLHAWPIDETSGELIDSQTDFDDELLHALNQISVDARCCFLLRAVQNLSYAEISELMQIPEGTAMSHVHRSRRQLKRLLEPRTSETEVVDGNL